jgi:adenosyl cobinamide kinase/adenosyl cobinamide phosphate guanylyltransferase
MIVGISGAAGSGKDTAAEALIQHLEYEKGFFAKPMKQMLAGLFGWDMDDLEDLKFKETPRPEIYGKTPRELLQSLGTEWGRNMVGPNLWVDAALHGVQRDRTVFTDVRFPNEAKLIRDAGGVLIHVACVDRATGTTSNAHSSEAWLPWLEVYADADIKVQFGAIAQLQEVMVNTVDAYLQNLLPRFVDRGEETDAQLDQLEDEIYHAISK